MIVWISVDTTVGALGFGDPAALLGLRNARNPAEFVLVRDASLAAEVYWSCETGVAGTFRVLLLVDEEVPETMAVAIKDVLPGSLRIGSGSMIVGGEEQFVGHSREMSSVDVPAARYSLEAFRVERDLLDADGEFRRKASEKQYRAWRFDGLAGMTLVSLSLASGTVAVGGLVLGRGMSLAISLILANAFLWLGFAGWRRSGGYLSASNLYRDVESSIPSLVVTLRSTS